MRLAIFGATTSPGKHLLAQALKHGYHVSVLVPNVARWSSWHERLRLVEGDARDPEAVFQTVLGADTVLSLIGASGSAWRARSAQATRNIVQAMSELQIRRVIVTSEFGVGDSLRRVPWWRRWRFWVRPLSFAQKAATEEVLRATDLEWTAVRAGPLTRQARPTGKYRAGTDVSVEFGPVSPRAVAHFMLRQVRSEAFVGHTPAIVRHC